MPSWAESRNGHGHKHEHMDNAGEFDKRAPPLDEKRNWDERAFTVGIGGPVGRSACIFSK